MSNQTQNNTPSISYGDFKVGDITGDGHAIGHGASSSVIKNGPQPSRDEIGKAFAEIKEKVNALPDGYDKEDAKEAVDKLEAEAGKGDQANEGRIRRGFRTLAETAPDAFEVAIAIFIHPIAGLGIAFEKIAERAKAEAKEP